MPLPLPFSARPATVPPVSYSFLAGAEFAIRNRGQDLPGVNQWDTAPSEERPTPVILVHGTAGAASTNWITLAPTLVNHGFSVFTLTYGAIEGASFPLSELGGLRRIRPVAVPQVAEFVDAVLAATGAPQVDLVGHSQGCVVAGAVAKHARPGAVRKVVSLASPWHGVGSARLEVLLTATHVRPLVGAVSRVGEDLVRGSDFLAWLWGPDGTPYVKGIGYTNISTRFDQFVVPHTTSLVAPPNEEEYSVDNIVLQHGCMLDFVDHAALPSDPRAVDLVLRALDPEVSTHIRCLPVAPVHGGILPGWLADRL